MILEAVILNIKEGQSKLFEKAMQEAKPIIVAQKGFIDFAFQKCIEKENQYLLLVNWKTLEDHEIGFRKSEDYQKWKALLHHFYEPFPIVEHYKSIQ